MLKQDHKRSQHEAEGVRKAAEAKEKEKDNLNEAFWKKLSEPTV